MIQDQIIALIEPSIQSLGYELWGCEYLAQGQYCLLRIYIDHAQGIGVEDCEQVSRLVSALLDVDDPIAGHYSLEVSSPGVPRPLFSASQYIRYVGQAVTIKLFKPVSGRRQWTGLIIAADEGTLTLDVAGSEPQTFLFSNIVKAHVTSK